LVTAVVVLVFGGLTLYFQNETFIKMKPTVIYILFGAVADRRICLQQAVPGDRVRCRLPSDRGRLAQVDAALGALLLALAVVNEIVWRTQSTDTWVNFKSFGVYR